jgi:hypothetical protein
LILDKKSLGKGGRDKVIDDEDITFHRMVAKVRLFFRLSYSHYLLLLLLLDLAKYRKG